MVHFVTSCMVIIVVVSMIDAGSIADAKALFSNITNGYNEDIRPIGDQNGKLTVYIDTDLLTIQDFDEVSGTLNILAVFLIHWNDVSLSWDPALYGDISETEIGQNNIWLPRLFNIKSSDTFRAISNSYLSVKIDHYGEVFWQPGSFIDIKCNPDVSYFPFDIQTCYIQLIAWGCSQQRIKLEPLRPELSLEFYEPNGEWSLDNTATGTHSVSGYSTATFNITISRLPAFHVVNTLMPIYLLLLMILVFVLPCDSGERVGFSLTVFLMLTVFITIVNAVLPSNSDSMSRLSYFIFSVLVVSGVIASVNILELRMYHKDDNLPVPQWLRRLMRILDCHFKSRRMVSEVCPHKSDQTLSNKNTSRKGIQLTEEEEEETVEVVPEMTWKEVVRILDKFYACLFFAVITVFIVVTLVVLYKGNR
ncbi:acetylcholine receptor subunit alpha-1-B-like [Pecten maximus]|uniref:acetylcholine receptor subunit alpha-1-B-like n=1 Tax=Pecten maximus TaxID=6579 RepID=UPI001458B8F2|nr:acetylcholine receptor subunit alpha-1-B-like [Pecten maximus]